MNLIVKGRHMELTPPIRQYAEEKIGKISRVVDERLLMKVEIELYPEKNPSIDNNQVAEVTLFTKGPVIRAKEAAEEMHAAIDLVAAKLERQVKRYKEKLVDKHSTPRVPDMAKVAQAPSLPNEPQEQSPIVKTKVVHVKPMSAEEAILQLELLGHDFFVYTDDDSAVNVLYRRNDGDYGLIQPRVG